MIIAPVSPLREQNKPVGFGNRRSAVEEGRELRTSQSKNTTDLGKMPVIVLLAMTPVVSDGKIPENFVTIAEAPKTEVATTPKETAAPSTYVIPSETQKTEQTTAPYGYECLKYQEINYVDKFKAQNKEYNLIFASNGPKKSVNYVYVIPTNTKGSKNNSDFPPEIMQLRHHDIGEGDFCGAIIDEDLRNSESAEIEPGKYRGTLRYELKLPDEIAQKVVDLVTGHSDFENKTIIKIKTVDYPNLHPIKLYE